MASLLNCLSLFNFVLFCITERFVPPIDRSYIENHPYQVSVERIGGRTCGGAIITELHILTAASCATK